jgi:hypothetical protein
MTDRAPTLTRAVAKDDGPSPARELAQRRSGTVEVLLLWHPESDQVELAVRDLATDASFHIDVAPGDAIDAFYHPYAYAARRESSDRGVRPETKAVDGSR